MRRFLMAACDALATLLPFTARQVSSDADVIGEIRFFGGNFAPRGWEFCNGQLLAISSNSALSSILGTTYGGDGRSTFALPDMRGRSPIHAGNSAGPGLNEVRNGQRIGSATTTLSQSNLPSHSHTAGSGGAHSHGITLGGTADSTSGSGKYLAETVTATRGAVVSGFSSSAGSTKLDTGAVDPASASGGNTGNTGNGVSFNEYQPGVGVNCIIALQGIYPPRS